MAWRTDRDESFRAFVLAERAALVRTATILSAGDRHRAEDAVQRGLTGAYVAWGRIRPQTRVAYVRRAVVNAVMDEHRRIGRRREVLTDALPDRPDLAAAPADDAPVIRMLAELPTGMRAAVVLRHVEGMSTAEAAAVLGCSEGTVRSQCARGLDKLRSALVSSTA